MAMSRSFPSTSSSSYRDRIRKARNRRFGVRKPPSKLKRKEMAKLREISMRLGGAQYFKKRFNEAAHCQVIFHCKESKFKISENRKEKFHVIKFK